VKLTDRGGAATSLTNINTNVVDGIGGGAMTVSIMTIIVVGGRRCHHHRRRRSCFFPWRPYNKTAR
jgi:hypothetical protein